MNWLAEARELKLTFFDAPLGPIIESAARDTRLPKESSR